MKLISRAKALQTVFSEYESGGWSGDEAITEFLCEYGSHDQYAEDDVREFLGD